MIGARGIVDYMIGIVVFLLTMILLSGLITLLIHWTKKLTFSLHLDRAHLLFLGVHMFYRSLGINVYCLYINYCFLLFHWDDDLSPVERSISSVK